MQLEIWKWRLGRLIKSSTHTEQYNEKRKITNHLKSNDQCDKWWPTLEETRGGVGNYCNTWHSFECVCSLTGGSDFLDKCLLRNQKYWSIALQQRSLKYLSGFVFLWNKEIWFCCSMPNFLGKFSLENCLWRFNNHLSLQNSICGYKAAKWKQ